MNKGDGMSFSEFTYPLLQAWDWWQMYHDRQIQVQIGGSDQYGNIVAGIDAVKYIAQNQIGNSSDVDHLRKAQDESSPMGLTVPLLTTSSGEKFGKSAGNAVWLDRNMTSPFDLYGVSIADASHPMLILSNTTAQFLLRSADADVEKYLKLFTFLPLDRIREIMTAHSSDAGKRQAQHTLACEVLELVHGPEEAKKTQIEHHRLRAPTLASFATAQAPSSGGTASGTQVVSERVSTLR